MSTGQGTAIDASIHSSASFFPTASQVAGMDITTLRSAGLSGRKAEYGPSHRTHGDGY